MKRKLTSLLLAGLLLLSLAACSGGTDPNKELVLYDGDITEVRIVHSMIKQLVEANSELTVTIKDQMTGVNMFNELTGNSPSCDLMFTYDGTLLTTFLKLDPTDVPEGQTLFDFASEVASRDYNVHLLAKVGLNNTYAVGVTQAVVDTYGVRTVSDLAPIAGQLRFGAEPEFYHDEGSMKYHPFVEFYGLEFQDNIQVDVLLKYTAVKTGNFEVMIVYATDGMNKDAGLVVLEDDRNFFPEYNGAILVQNDLFERMNDAAPNLEEILNQLSGNISTEDMIELTYLVDVGVDGDPSQKQEIADVARAFLESKGLL